MVLSEMYENEDGFACHCRSQVEQLCVQRDLDKFEKLAQERWFLLFWERLIRYSLIDNGLNHLYRLSAYLPIDTCNNNNR